MSTRSPAGVRVLWGLAGLLVLAAAALFLFGKFGGTAATGEQPYRWDGDGPLVISHQGGTFDGSSCLVRPEAGEERSLEAGSVASGAMRVEVVEPWFAGPAQVSCTSAKILTVPGARYVPQYGVLIFLALGVAAVSGLLARRHRRRSGTGANPDTSADPPGEPASDRPPADAGPADASSTIAVTTHTMLSGGGALAGLSKPRIALDGREHAGRWGRNELPIAPGAHVVQVWVPYPLPRRRGLAEVTVQVPPQTTTELEYWVPLWPFQAGALGPAPQRHPGIGLTLGILGGTVALLCVAAVWAASAAG